MAELLVAGKGIYSDSLGVYLRDALAGEYCVVVAPVVQRCPLDAVVVSPNGLTVLRVAGQPDAGNGHYGDERVPARPQTRTVSDQDAAQATRALQAFLHDEFPALQPRIAYLRIGPLTEDQDGWAILEPAGLEETPLAQALAAQPGMSNAVLGSPEARAELAMALRDRQLTWSQRAGNAFVFRSGGVLQGGRVWTIRDAIHHMDRYPQDGIYHLRNGTLADWLEQEGATQLAAVARAAVREGMGQPRVMLETFLLGTGQVARPHLVVDPAPVDLGYVLSGQRGARAVQLKRGPGRGFLFGRLAPGEPCLEVEPHTFDGNTVDGVVTVDTAQMPVERERQSAEVFVDSSAAEQPIAVPVHFRVVAWPSFVSRYVLRPLCCTVVACILGLALGAELSVWAVPLTQWAPALSRLPIWPGAWWPLGIAVVWAVLGIVRGFAEPPAWPLRYTLARWVPQLLGWALLLPGLVWLATLSWAGPGMGAGFALAGDARLALVLAALALAALPATLGEMALARAATSRQRPMPRRTDLRPVLTPALIATALALLVAAAPLAPPAWSRFEQGGTVKSAEEWGSGAANRLDTTLKGVQDQLYMRYYQK
jgi:hypothetical protein